MIDLDNGKTQTLHPSKSKVECKSFLIGGVWFYAGIFDMTSIGDSFCLVAWDVEGDGKWRFVHMLQANFQYVEGNGGYDLYCERIIRELTSWVERVIPSRSELSPHLTELQKMIDSINFNETEKKFTK